MLNNAAADAAAKSLQSRPTLRPHRRQPTRLPRPWDSPGKNTGVGCHYQNNNNLIREDTLTDILCIRSLPTSPSLITFV